jgi:hypothetical protein
MWVRGTVGLIAICLATGIAAQSHAQSGSAGRDPGHLPPLRPEPGDIWADVHSWTNSRNLPQPARNATAAQRLAPAPQAEAFPQAGNAVAAGAADAGRMVVTNATRRSNVRVEPDMRAPVARTMPPSTTLRVFGEAPGGWMNVGDDQPFGWIHQSALRR